MLTLQRIRIMNVNLGRMKVGDYRNLTEWEIEELKIQLEESSNDPAAVNKKEVRITSYNVCYTKLLRRRLVYA